MKKITEKAFTLVELLIVIGIIGILAVTLLVALNPQEAQRKSRDAKRLRDAQTLQGILEQWVNDGNAIPAGWSENVTGTDTTVTNADATSSFDVAAGTSQQSCTAGNNWLDVDVCDYVKAVPVDPSNAQIRTCQAVDGDCLMHYAFQFDGAEYEIIVRQESTTNADKVTEDGGDDDNWFELYSKDSDVIPAASI